MPATHSGRNRYAKEVSVAAETCVTRWLGAHFVGTRRGARTETVCLRAAWRKPSAPGPADGHGGWAAGLQIGSMLTRCVHMTAAHENRNPLRLDSTIFKASPSNFQFPAGISKMIYSGVHSGVGGGERSSWCLCDRRERWARLKTSHSDKLSRSTPKVQSTSPTWLTCTTTISRLWPRPA